jgi:hypothetical protein
MRQSETPLDFVVSDCTQIRNREYTQEGYALLTVLNRIGFGPHHAVDWVISRRFSVKIPQTKWRVTYSGVGDNETKLPLVVPLRRR